MRRQRQFQSTTDFPNNSTHRPRAALDTGLLDRDWGVHETATETATGTLLNKRINEQMAAQVRYNSWYIFLPSFAKQQT